MVHNQYSILDNTSCTTILDCKHIFLKQCVHHKTDFTCSYTPELYCLKIDSFDTNCLQSYVIHVPVNWFVLLFQFCLVESPTGIILAILLSRITLFFFGEI